MLDVKRLDSTSRFNQEREGGQRGDVSHQRNGNGRETVGTRGHNRREDRGHRHSSGRDENTNRSNRNNRNDQHRSRHS